uniref:Uncharacterized protein n=1 Tax=Meloidogyne incognita TaxID=6306 RepID=A0A914L426_MELIC
MITIRNYFLIPFLFAVIICQFGVKAPRGAGNRNRGQQVANNQEYVNQLLQTLYELVPQGNRTNRRNPRADQQVQDIVNYIRSMHTQVDNLSDRLAELQPNITQEQLEHLTQLLAQLNPRN